MDNRAPHITAPYVEARRALVKLWKVKGALLAATHTKFPSTHSLYQGIHKVVYDPAVQQARLLADGSACAFADAHGHDLFRQEVDGVTLPAVTHWFYGLRMCEDSTPRERRFTKSFGMAEAQLFEEMQAATLVFLDKVSMLPLVDGKKLGQQRASTIKLSAKITKILEKHSASLATLRYIRAQLPSALTDIVISHCGESEHPSSSSSTEAQDRKRRRF